jgi:hypothetical protein
MFAGIKSVNFNDLHNRETFMVFDSKEKQKALDFHYALIVGREKENIARTPYVCYYVGLTQVEFARLRLCPDALLDEFSFIGIPNDTIDVSHDVYKVFLQDKPMAWVGIDRPQYDHDEFVEFIRIVLEMKEMLSCNKKDLSFLSSRMPLESLKATRESSDASPAPLE